MARAVTAHCHAHEKFARPLRARKTMLQVAQNSLSHPPFLCASLALSTSLKSLRKCGARKHMFEGNAAQARPTSLHHGRVGQSTAKSTINCQTLTERAIRLVQSRA